MLGQYSFDDDLSQFYTFTIKRLSLVNGRDDGYKDMFIKPYISKINPRELEEMVDRFVKTGNLREKGEGVISISNGILAKAGISGDWGMKRYAFVLEVRCESTRSASMYDLIIAGYTDPTYSFRINNYGTSFDNFDNNLIFHINYCKKLDLDRSGKLISVSDLGVMDDSSVSNNITQTLRPADVVTNIQVKEMSDNVGGSNILVGNPINDYNATFNRKHNSSNNYLNSIFDALTVNIGDTRTGNDVKIDSTYRRKTNTLLHGAIIQLGNTNIKDLPFIKVICNGINSVGPNKFNLLSLRAISPTFHPATIQVIDVNDNVGMQSMQSAGFLYASKENTLGFNSIDNYSTVVQDIHNIMVNFMVSNYLGGIDIIVHNARGMDEMPMERPKAKYIINNLQALRQTDNPESYMGVINANLNNICQTIDRYLNRDNSNIEYNIALNMSASIDSSIMLQVRGFDVYGNYEVSEPRIYRFPTFADMNYTSMVGNNNSLENLTSDVETIVHTIQESL